MHHPQCVLFTPWACWFILYSRTVMNTQWYKRAASSCTNSQLLPFFQKYTTEARTISKTSEHHSAKLPPPHTRKLVSSTPVLFTWITVSVGLTTTPTCSLIQSPPWTPTLPPYLAQAQGHPWQVLSHSWTSGQRRLLSPRSPSQPTRCCRMRRLSGRRLGLITSLCDDHWCELSISLTKWSWD